MSPVLFPKREYDRSSISPYFCMNNSDNEPDCSPNYTGFTPLASVE